MSLKRILRKHKGVWGGENGYTAGCRWHSLAPGASSSWRIGLAVDTPNVPIACKNSCMTAPTASSTLVGSIWLGQKLARPTVGRSKSSRWHVSAYAALLPLHFDGTDAALTNIKKSVLRAPGEPAGMVVQSLMPGKQTVCSSKNWSGILML